MNLSPRNILRSIAIQISDAFKIKEVAHQPCGNNKPQVEDDLFENKKTELDEKVFSENSIALDAREKPTNKETITK